MNKFTNDATVYNLRTFVTLNTAVHTHSKANRENPNQIELGWQYVGSVRELGSGVRLYLYVLCVRRQPTSGQCSHECWAIAMKQNEAIREKRMKCVTRSLICTVPFDSTKTRWNWHTFLINYHIPHHNDDIIFIDHIKTETEINEMRARVCVFLFEWSKLFAGWQLLSEVPTSYWLSLGLPLMLQLTLPNENKSQRKYFANVI